MVALSQRLKEYENHLEEQSTDEAWLSKILTKTENFIDFLYFAITFLCVAYLLKLCLYTVRSLLQVRSSYISC